MRARLPMLVGVLVVALPAAIGAAVAVSGQAWVPTSDNALIALGTSDVGAHTPTYGVYSRFGFHHPGPALYLTLAPTWWVFGPSGLVLGAGVVAGAAAGATSWFCWRRGGAVVGLLGGTVVLLAIRSLAAEVIDPWNPWMSLVPFGLLVVATWSALDGDRWAVPVALVVASWLVQVHLGFALMAGALAGAVVVAAALVWRREPAEGRGAWRAPAIAAGVGLALVWFLPVIGELADEPGNLELIVASFSDPTEEPAGWAKGLGTVSRGVGVTSGWLTGTDDVDPFLGELFSAGVWSLGVTFLVSVALGAWGWRRRDEPRVASALRLLVVVWATVVLAVISVARILGPTYYYLVRWQWVLAAMMWLALLLLLAALVLGRRDPPRWSLAVLWTALGMAALTATVTVARAELPDARNSEAVLAVLEATLASIEVQGGGPVLVTFEGSAFGEYQTGLVAALEDRGLVVWVPDERALEFGERRTRAGRDPGSVVSIVSGEPAARRLAAGEEPIVVWDPLSAAERAELEPLATRIAAIFEASERGDPLPPLLDEDEQDRVRELNAKGELVAVFAER